MSFLKIILIFTCLVTASLASLGDGPARWNKTPEQLPTTMKQRLAMLQQRGVDVATNRNTEPETATPGEVESGIPMEQPNEGGLSPRLESFPKEQGGVPASGEDLSSSREESSLYVPPRRPLERTQGGRLPKFDPDTGRIISHGNEFDIIANLPDDLQERMGRYLGASEIDKYSKASRASRKALPNLASGYFREQSHPERISHSFRYVLDLKNSNDASEVRTIIDEKFAYIKSAIAEENKQDLIKPMVKVVGAKSGFTRYLLPYTGWLYHLSLRGTQFTEGDIERLSTTENLKNMRILDLSSTELLDVDIGKIVNSRNLHLLVLLLGENSIGDVGLYAISTAPPLTHLIQLSVENNNISPIGVKYLAKSKYLYSLRSLDLSKNPVESEGLIELSNSEGLSILESLKLSFCYLDDSGVIALAKSPYIKKLRELDLHGNNISDAGVKELAESRNLSELRNLDLSGNPLGDEGVTAILSSSFADSLRELRIPGTNLSDNVVMALRKKFKQGLALTTS